MSETHLCGAGLAGFPYILPSSALGGDGAVAPSNRITLGLIGTGNINTHHREAFLRENDARIIAVCDPVTSRRRSHRDRINQAYGNAACADYRDFRELLARDDIDAVCIGTPDHWHAAHAIAAMQAGRDVYVEKPLTLTVAEGRRVAETARIYGRILQTGLQRRSGGAFRYACELVRNGRIGRLTRVEVGIIGINKGIQPGRHFERTPVPGDFDYDLWLGPAPFAPFSPQRVARGNEVCYWYYISDYTAGFITGNGVHFVDIAQWGIGDEVKPVQVHTLSAEIPADGLIDDAITWHSEVVYENGVTMSYSSEGNPHPDGIRFLGTEGWLHVTGGGTLSAGRPNVLKSVIGPNEIHLYTSPGHHRNFLDCIKTRRPAAASAEIGHHATTTCNLAAISARLGRKVRWTLPPSVSLPTKRQTVCCREPCGRRGGCRQALRRVAAPSAAWGWFSPTIPKASGFEAATRRMFENAILKTGHAAAGREPVLNFAHSDFAFVSDFVLRASDLAVSSFGFRIWDLENRVGIPCATADPLDVPARPGRTLRLAGRRSSL